MLNHGKRNPLKKKKTNKPKRWDAIAKYIPKDKDFVMAEIGVESGKTTSALLRIRPKLKIIAVDRWIVTPPGDTYFQGSRVMARWDAQTWKMIYNKFLNNIKQFKNRVQIIRSDSISAAAQIEDHSLDLIFIDADHSYEGTSKDIKTWFPKLKSDGIMCGHDYENTNTYGNVKKAVDEIFGQDITLDVDHTWFAKLAYKKQDKNLDKNDTEIVHDDESGGEE